MRANKLLTTIFVVVLYSFIIPFYIQRFFHPNRVEVAHELNQYSFPQLGIEFSGPAFISVSSGNDSIKLVNKLANVDVSFFKKKNSEGKPWCRKLQAGESEKTECLKFINGKVIVFSTDSRAYFTNVENMAASATILNKK